MFKWLSSKKTTSSSFPGTLTGSKEEKTLYAVAMLLSEIMHADHQLCSQEKSTVTTILYQQFGMSEAGAQELLNKVNKHMKDAISLHEYTSFINSTFQYEQKVELIKSLWHVAYSDNMLDRYEEHLIRRLADLLYISHSDYIREKHVVSNSQ